MYSTSPTRKKLLLLFLLLVLLLEVVRWVSYLSRLAISGHLEPGFPLHVEYVDGH